MTIHNALGIGKQKDSAIHGVVPAIVTNNEDTENRGRVRLTFPWLSDKNESDWCRIVTMMAGDDMGFYVLPEVGDEVLVAFDRGNINCPYVIGMLWNGKTKVPEENTGGKNNVRTFKTRSGHQLTFDDNTEEKKAKVQLVSSAGHSVTMDDASGAEKVEIVSKAGHTLTLDDAPGGEKIGITDKSGSNSIVIDSVKNSITIESAAQLKISGNIVEIHGKSMLTLKSDTLVSIEGALVKIN